jgi:hypothetical protein
VKSAGFASVKQLEPAGKRIVLDPAEKRIIRDPAGKRIVLDPAEKRIVFNPNSGLLLLRIILNYLYEPMRIAA